MRKFLVPLAVILALLVLPLGAFAAGQNDIKVKINDQILYFDVNPIIDNGRTLVPVRGIFENLGADVQWIAQTSTVLATRGDTQVRLQIGNASAYVNDQVIPLDVPAKIVGGSTMVPVRFISESLGATVGWESSSSTVLIQDANAKSVDYEKFYNAFMGSRQAEFKFSIKETISLMGQTVDATVSGSGAVNNNDARVTASISIPELGSAMPMNFVIKDWKLYLKLGDTPWNVLSTGIPQDILDYDTVSEAMLTEILKESFVKQENNVMINGKPTTKYTIKSDDDLLISVINQLFSTSSQFSTMNQKPTVSDTDDLVIVYIDAQDQIVKQQVQAEMSGTIPDLKADFKVKATGDIDYFNIGKPVTITAPEL